MAHGGLRPFGPCDRSARAPRHYGTIAERYGSLIREAPLHRGAFVPDFDNDSTLLKNLCHSCLNQHDADADTNDSLDPLWALDSSDKPSWTSLSSFNPSIDLNAQLSPHTTEELLLHKDHGCLILSLHDSTARGLRCDASRQPAKSSTWSEFARSQFGASSCATIHGSCDGCSGVRLNMRRCP